MTIVNDHLRGRAIPGDAVRARRQRHQAAEHRQVVPGHRVADIADDLIAVLLDEPH